MSDECKVNPLWSGRCDRGTQACDVQHGSSLAAPACSLSGFGSEILIATWEAQAAQCDQTADQFAAVTKNLVCSFREKARAYRKCIEDLRRQMGHESKRQPTENDKLRDGAPETPPAT